MLLANRSNKSIDFGPQKQVADNPCDLYQNDDNQATVATAFQQFHHIPLDFGHLLDILIHACF